MSQQLQVFILWFCKDFQLWSLQEACLCGELFMCFQLISHSRFHPGCIQNNFVIHRHTTGRAYPCSLSLQAFRSWSAVFSRNTPDTYCFPKDAGHEKVIVQPKGWAIFARCPVKCFWWKTRCCFFLFSYSASRPYLKTRHGSSCGRVNLTVVWSASHILAS